MLFRLSVLSWCKIAVDGSSFTIRENKWGHPPQKNCEFSVTMQPAVVVHTCSQRERSSNRVPGYTFVKWDWGKPQGSFKQRETQCVLPLPSRSLKIKHKLHVHSPSEA
ncbi:UNVERIFIED_CONTAM: hypothetical protein K2H54_072347 [Gekko kuhli]